MRNYRINAIIEGVRTQIFSNETLVKNREHSLAEQTASIYRSIAHDSMDGFLIVDMQGQIMDVNTTYCKMSGYSRKELLKMNVADFEVRGKPISILKRLRQLKRSGKGRFLTEHQKKDGTAVNIEITANYADYLGGLAFFFLRDVTGIMQTENDQFRHRAESRKAIESQLSDSYKHLGTINRKISMLLELEKFPTSKKRRQEVLDHILHLAMNISSAPMGYLYGAEGKGKFNLLSYKGCKEEQREKIKVITSRKVGLLKHLLKQKSTISGDIKVFEAELLALDNKLEYFVTLPLSKGSLLGGFIFLGFDKKHTVATQDLEFLDIFAMHASNALIKAGILQ